VAAIETAFGQRASVLNCSDFVLTFRIKISGILRPKPIIKCSHFYRELLTTNQGVDAKIIMTEGKPEAIAPPREPAIVLTPKSGPKPRINGAKVFGARPGAPFLFTIAARVPKQGTTEIWAKDLEDGSKAVGLFNRGEDEVPMTLKWSDLGLAGKLNVRDLWRQKDLGKFPGQFQTSVPRHGVVLLKIGHR
jgi:hypothetical protein